MKHKEIAEYFGLSSETVRRWPAEKRHRASVEMQSGAEPQIIKLIGEISQLCYIFDCKHVVCSEQRELALFSATSDTARLSMFNNLDMASSKSISVDLNLPTAVAELQKVKQTLESFIY